MWPTIFEFSWDAGHMIFFGVFYSVLIVLSTSLVYVFAKSIIDTFNGGIGIAPPLTEASEAKEEVGQ